MYTIRFAKLNSHVIVIRFKLSRYREVAKVLRMFNVMCEEVKTEVTREEK